MVEFPCSRCKAPVAMAPDALAWVNTFNRELEIRGEQPLKPTEVALCEKCVHDWRADQSKASQIEHDRWCRLWKLFKARRIEVTDLPQAMRENWNTIVMAELANRGQVTSRKAPPEEDLR